jgi:predicted RNase H-like nuclease (RuvC/YqgF family)
MDYSKLTKQELLGLVTEQQALKDAVEAKDFEMTKLVKEKEDLKRKLYEAAHLEKDIQVRDARIETLKKQLEDTQDYYKNQIEQSQEQYKKQIEQYELVIKQQAEKITQERNIDEILEQNKLLKADAEFAVNVANKYIKTFSNYLKVQEGALQTALDMDEILKKQIQTKEV